MEHLFCPSCLAWIRPEEERCSACGAAKPHIGWPVHEHLGRIIGGKYHVRSKLGQGGFGVVLLARHLQSGHDLGNVVLKFLHPHLASQPQLRRRFINEARAARALRSQHVVKVFDFDFDERGLPYIVMEYLEGKLLSAFLRTGPLDPSWVLRFGVQIAGALYECHGAGILHRDLTPKNILLLSGRHDVFVKLLDFGIAHMPDTSITRTILGTPRYMSPEQIKMEDLDPGADIFSLGVVLFESFCGKPPIEAPNDVSYLHYNLSREPRRLRQLSPEMPGELDDLLHSMMAKDCRDRPASMADVEAALIDIGSAKGWLTPARFKEAPTGPQSRMMMAVPTEVDADKPLQGEPTLAGLVKLGSEPSVLLPPDRVEESLLHEAILAYLGREDIDHEPFTFSELDEGINPGKAQE